MEAPSQPDEGITTAHTPESSPERGLGEGGVRLRPRSLPYRLKQDLPDALTPESSPERGYGGVRLSPVKSTASTASLRSSPEKSLQPRVEGADAPSTPTKTPCLVGDTSESGSHHEPNYRSLINHAHRPPKRLSHGLFPYTPRRVTSPEQKSERSAGRETLDGTAQDSSPLSRQENLSPRAVQETATTDQNLPQGPPAYQPRPLMVQRARQNRFRHIISSHSRRQETSQWFRLVYLDLLFMLITLAVTGIVLQWGQLWRRNDRLFPMTFDPHSGTWFGPAELSYPQHDFILGITFTGALIPLIPLVVVILMQFWVRNWLDLNAATFAMKKAVVLM